MKRLPLMAAASTIAAVLGAIPAVAQSNRTFVSGQGADTGTCAVGAPCRSFAYAVSQTSYGGEVVVLNSAGYGAVTINQAISITNEEGVEAAITVTSGSGITIAAGPSDAVHLTGITLMGINGGGANGISFTSGGTLDIHNCVATGFAGAGINLVPTASSSFDIADTIVANNAYAGIALQPSGSGTTTNALFERIQAFADYNGVLLVSPASGTIEATVKDSEAASNANGFAAQAEFGTPTINFTVVGSAAINNSQYGLFTDGHGVTMVLAGSALSGNATGFYIAASSVIKTLGNNDITDTTNTGTLTKLSQQ